MKKLALLFLPLLLVGCASNSNSSSSQSETSSSSETSSEVESTLDSSSSSQGEDTNPDLASKEVVSDVINKLRKANGHPNKATIETLYNAYYLTSGDEPLNVKAKINGVSHRYVYNEKPIVTLDKTTSYFDEGKNAFQTPISEHNQKSYDNRYFYDLTLSDDPDVGNQLKRYAFNQNQIEEFLAFGVGQSESDALEILKSAIGVKDYACEIRGADGYSDNGIWNLSSRMIQYEPGTKIVKQMVTYNDSFTIKNGVIVKASQEIETALYAAGQKANWVVTESSYVMEQGEYLAYPGTPYDPNNY